MAGFPNVPPLPGVPPLPRPPGFVIGAAVRALQGDSRLIRALFPPAQWGVFNDRGSQVLNPDTIKTFDFRRGFRVADFPIEGGEFASYNKVRQPYDIGLTVVKSGSEATRAEFLSQVERLTESLELYTIVMPEGSYASANFVEFTQRRSAEGGVSMLTLDLYVRQIRVAPSADMSTERPLETQENGAVQPVNPTPTQTAAAQGG